MNIENVFVINLNERKDRWEYIQSHLNGIGISNFQRVSATKLSCEGSTVSPVKLAQISCFHSHLKTLRKSKDLDQVLILEDDCVFLDSNFTRIDNFIQNHEWEILYLGANRKIYRDNDTRIYLSNIQKVDDNVVKIDECGTTHAILYNRKFVERVLSLYPTDDDFFIKAFSMGCEYYKYDDFLNYFTKIQGVQKYCMYPIMCGQIESFSDIQFVHTRYNDEILGSWE